MVGRIEVGGSWRNKRRSVVSEEGRIRSWKTRWLVSQDRRMICKILRSVIKNMEYGIWDMCCGKEKERGRD